MFRQVRRYVPPWPQFGFDFDSPWRLVAISLTMARLNPVTPLSLRSLLSTRRNLPNNLYFASGGIPEIAE